MEKEGGKATNKESSQESIGKENKQKHIPVALTIQEVISNGFTYV